MNNLNGLFSHRLARHSALLLKYLRLVFTDHFVIALFFFAGALGVAYQNGLKTITHGVWWGPFVTVLVLVITAQLGRLATLLEPADEIFLLPAERPLHDYLKHARNYSLLMAELIQVAVWVVLLPFLAQGDRFTLIEAIVLLAVQLIIKAAQINLQLRQAVLQTRLTNQLLIGWSWGLPLAAYAVALWLTPWAGLVIGLVALVWTETQLWSSWQHGQLSWHTLIEDESNRMLTLYRFFNLFTDVPQISGKVHRRRYLDPLWRLLNGDRKNPYLLLFSRGLGRDGDAFGLVIRLTIIAMALLVFIHNQWLSLLIMILAVYLIGFQLLPFYRQYENKVFTHLYPVEEADKMQAFRRVLTWTLTGTGVLLVIVDVAVNWSLIRLGLDVIAIVAELVIFIGWYTKLRLKKM